MRPPVKTSLEKHLSNAKAYASVFVRKVRG